MPPFLTSPLLTAAGLRHAFFTREGGVSAGLYASLNCGPGSQDDPALVAENRRRAAAALSLAPDQLFVAYQVHSARAVEAPWSGERPQADAVVTTDSRVGAGVLTADCAPILLADRQAGVVAAAHAGWKGALHGVIEDALRQMIDRGAQPSRIVAAIGPVIGPRSYEVGEAFEAEFLATDPASASRFAPGSAADKRLFDLPGYCLDRLSRAGVVQAEWIGADTLDDEARLFSHRRAVLRGQAESGRLLSVVRL